MIGHRDQHANSWNAVFFDSQRSSINSLWQTKVNTSLILPAITVVGVTIASTAQY